MESEVIATNKVLRSASHSDVFGADDSTSPNTNATPTSTADSTSSAETFSAATKLINAQPQDFVIVNGKPFRVSRTPRHAPPVQLEETPSGTASTESFLNFFEEFKTQYSGRTYDDLLHELFESRRTIHRQELEIRKLKTSIEVASTPDLTNIRNRAATASKIALRRLRVSEAAATDSPNTGAIDTIASHTFPTISPKGSENPTGTAEESSSRSPDDGPKSALRFGSDVPKSLRIDVSRTLIASGGGVHATEEEYNAFLRLSATAPAVSTSLEGFTPEVDVPAQQPGSAQLDRRKSRLPVTQRIRNLHLETPADVSPERAPKKKAAATSSNPGATLFDWQNRLREPGAPMTSDSNRIKKYPILLFIVHDNPMLGNAAEAACKSGDLMPVMLESKDDAGASYFIIATIIHSGAMNTIAGANPDHPRGSQCMVCGDIIAIKSKIKDLSTRPKPGHTDIIEIDLAHLPKDCLADVSSPEKFKKFLAPCTARVDVIMDPSRNDPGWYPYWEGTRKMAPQFRSRGIGYIRLGDDMSMNGTAFLSTDAGASFLDDGKNSVEVRETKPVSNGVNINPPTSARKRTDSADDGESSARPHSHRGRASLGSRGQGHSSSLSSSSAAIKSILHNIRNYDNVSIGSTSVSMSWSERVTALQRLQKDIQEYPGSEGSPDWLGEALNVLAESIVKQKNPNVAKELLLTVNSIAPFLAQDTSTDGSLALGFRSLVLEIIHLLRHANKGISDSARISLDKCMNVNALSLSSLTRLSPSVYTELLFGPNKVSTGKAVTSTAANTSKVLQWLTDFSMLSKDSVTKEDLSKLYADLMRPLKGFMSHREESTRDASINLLSHIIFIDLFVTRKIPHLDGVAMYDASWPSHIQLLVNKVSPEGLATMVQIDKDYPKISHRVVNASLSLLSTAEISNTMPTSEATSVSSNKPRLKLSVSSGAKGSGAPSSVGSHGPVPEARGLTTSDSQRLDNEWFEAKLVLKKVPSDLASWNSMLEVVDRSADFFKSLSTTARKYSVPIGKLLRIVLPFDESTSSGDQAAISDINAYDADARIPPELLSKYRPFAVSLRSLIRVKMADEADLQQAETVMKQLKSFCDNVRSLSASSGISVVELLTFA